MSTEAWIMLGVVVVFFFVAELAPDFIAWAHHRITRAAELRRAWSQIDDFKCIQCGEMTAPQWMDRGMCFFCQLEAGEYD